jgi:hypothetical protein
MSKYAISRPKLVQIDWVDSHQRVAWTTEDPATEALPCRSVGWLVHDGKTAKTICPHMTVQEMPQRTGEMTIPACAITKMRVLR